MLRRAASSLISRPKRRRRTSRIMAIVVARRQLLILDVKCAIMRFHEPVRARHDHRADRIRAHDMGIVVNLDPARRPLKAESLGKRGEKLCLRGRLGQFASQRRAGILLRVRRRDRCFSPFCGTCDLDAVAGALAQGVFEHAAIFDVAGQQNEARRRLVGIKLRHEGIEDLGRREAFVGARKIGAIAPVLKGPEEKDLDAELSGLFGDRRTHPPPRRVFGLMPWAPWMAESAAMRSRSRAARSKSIRFAAPVISPARRSRTARLLPDRKSRASRTSSA